MVFRDNPRPQTQTGAAAARCSGSDSPGLLKIAFDGFGAPPIIVAANCLEAADSTRSLGGPGDRGRAVTVRSEAGKPTLKLDRKCHPS